MVPVKGDRAPQQHALHLTWSTRGSSTGDSVEVSAASTRVAQPAASGQWPVARGQRQSDGDGVRRKPRNRRQPMGLIPARLSAAVPSRLTDQPYRQGHLRWTSRRFPCRWLKPSGDIRLTGGLACARRPAARAGGELPDLIEAFR